MDIIYCDGLTAGSGYLKEFKSSNSVEGQVSREQQEVTLETPTIFSFSRVLLQLGSMNVSRPGLVRRPPNAPRIQSPGDPATDRLNAITILSLPLPFLPSLPSFRFEPVFILFYIRISRKKSWHVEEAKGEKINVFLF